MPSPGADVNIALTLTRRAESDPNQPAIFEPIGRLSPDKRSYSVLSFQELEHYANRMAHALLAAGLKPGTRAILMVKPSREFFGLTFAVFKAGIIPVFIDPGMGIRGLGKCIAESRATGFIGIPAAHLARRLFGWGRQSITHFVSIQSGDRFRSWQKGQSTSHHQLSALPASPPEFIANPDSEAAILFTSGSTGPAKGVVYTHHIFNAQVSSLQSLLNIRPGEVDLCTFPLFALFAPALGMTSVIPRMDFTRPGRVDPREVITPIQRFQVTNLFGSPALLRRVQSFGSAHATHLPSLNRVVSAGAPVPADVIAGVKSILDTRAQIYTPYGATEALPVACIGSDEILAETAALTAQGRGVCVGRVVPNLTASIIPVSDQPVEKWSDVQSLSSGEIGEIVVSAPQVTQLYDARPDANRTAKIFDDTVSPPRFRHRMGDLGYLDSSGRLWFCGRKSHRVCTVSGPLDTIPTEAIFNQHPAVFRSALVGVGKAPQQIPVICVELMPGSHDWPKIQADLRAIALQHNQLRPIEVFLRHRGFPVDVRHNSKIFKEKLAHWACGGCPE